MRPVPPLRRLVPPLVAFAVFAVPLAAQAACFTIVDGRNRPVYQSTSSPIDLTGSIATGMARFAPGHFLIISPNNGCAAIGARSTGANEAASLLRTSASDLDYAGTSPAPETPAASPSPFPAETVYDGGLTLGRRGVLGLPPGTVPNSGADASTPAPTTPARVR